MLIVPTPSFKDIEKSLYSYWEELEIVKELDPEVFKLIHQKDGKVNIRSHIIKILREGIKDTPPDEEEESPRYVLSASEIQEELDNKLEEPVTISNVYFHLQKLEDADLVKIVASLPSGKRYTSYYGRTARVFILKDDLVNPQSNSIKSLERNLPNVEKVIKLIDSLNPELAYDEAEEVLSDLFEVNNHLVNHEKSYTLYFTKWLVKHQEHIKKFDINLIDFYYMFYFILNYNPEFVEKMQRIIDLLHIDFSVIEDIKNEANKKSKDLEQIESTQ